MTEKQFIYWDACTFLSWFNNNDESHQSEQCKGTIEKAKNGDVYIVTSAITLTEVIKLKNKPPLSESNEKAIKDFFENKFIKIAGLERFTAEDARHLIWKYSHLKPKDSIHLATALRNKIPVLHTFDSHFLRLNDQLSNITIIEPDIPFQMSLLNN